MFPGSRRQVNEQPDAPKTSLLLLDVAFIYRLSCPTCDDTEDSARVGAMESVTMPNSPDKDPAHAQAIDKIAEQIDGIPVAMITTIGEDGELHSRPMQVTRARFDGHLWFFTAAGSGKAEELAGDPHVNICFSDPLHRRFVSIAGHAHVEQDATRYRDVAQTTVTDNRNTGAGITDNEASTDRRTGTEGRIRRSISDGNTARGLHRDAAETDRGVAEGGLDLTGELVDSPTHCI